jgi:HK97 family phage prohead protease
MQRKQFNLFSEFTTKYLEDSDELIIEGLANSTTKDRVGDVIKQEAWSQKGLTNYLKNPIVLAFHDHSRPIGKVVDYTVDERGLRIRARISKAAGDISTLIKDGILSAFSVGFQVKDADYDKEKETFFIKELELLEISVVSVPANADSIFSIKKAFDNDEEYNSFKEEFIVAEEKAKETTEVEETIVTETQEVTKQETPTLTKEDVAELLKSNTEAVAAQFATLFEKTKEVEEKSTETEKEEMTVEVKDSGVEKLLAEMEKRIADREATLNEALEGVRAELKEKTEEISAIQKAKMQFEERGGVVDLTSKEKDEAVLLSKITGKGIGDTALGRKIIEKSGKEHWNAGATNDWEQEFSLRVLDELRMRLVVGELFSSRTIQMNTIQMNIPINPEAGSAEWINPTAFRSSDGTSTGTAVDHELNDIVLVSKKLAAKEFIGYEEEEDSIIPLLGFIRDAVVRRMARKWDQTLIFGADGGASATDPIAGLGTLAQTAGGGFNTTLSIGASAKVDVATLQTVRRGLGNYGLNPADVIYVVSPDAYFDLLEDPDFRTMDMVGDKATILRGQIGAANGSPVIVSAEFPAKAANKECVLAINLSNFLVGEHRTLMIERDRDIENQKNLIVATRRLGFTTVTSGQGVSAATWVA